MSWANPKLLYVLLQGDGTPCCVVIGQSAAIALELLTPLMASSNLQDMFNLGLPELLVIGAAALLVFGPKRLPEFAKSLGKGIRDFKKALEGGTDENETASGESKDSIAPPVQDPHSVAQNTATTSDIKNDTKPR